MKITSSAWLFIPEREADAGKPAMQPAAIIGAIRRIDDNDLDTHYLELRTLCSTTGTMLKIQLTPAETAAVADLLKPKPRPVCHDDDGD